MNKNDQAWYAAREITPHKRILARRALEDIRSGSKVLDALRRNPLPDGEGFLNKSALVAVYRDLVARGEWQKDPGLLAKIRLKPMRTLSGVTTVTVLTKPYPCPGKCIFCPTDIRMPKSYLPDEPGAMRALHHEFDPYEQVTARIEALHAVGHPTDKIELLVLGGTWSSYRKDYQEWFIKRCFEALNERTFDSLAKAQTFNETAEHRNVGLVVETRPDHVTPKELVWLRALGVTKVQIGVQSMDDRILELNHRGHTAAEARAAFVLLRAAGFKIVAHWMPNLLGATPASDYEDFADLWDGLNPDELKIYPTQLLANAELYEFWQRGEYTPYETDELIKLIADIKTSIPRYCRVNRIIRDIPSTNVVEGNRRTSLRMDVRQELKRRGEVCQCVRCREVRGQDVQRAALRLDDLIYKADFAEEHFLSYTTPDDKLAGFLRLSLPQTNAPATGLSDLKTAAIIREVHIYGQSLRMGQEHEGAAQHSGLGTELLEEAAKIARERGYQRLAVISAVGTRQYYLTRGFQRGELYLVQNLVTEQ
ncbi:MAG: tRNA uridine(34) 5-carboxymethylaminomethyl modification radical SAM/GNAT enzyme Elp3 [Anaerolineales bacterium]|nr:tRNA uridine(34) 5-carboxymethylaminomethyl modification radical SAM/GNAT enzyme Elp3 [Anaerolineales bacterium]